MIMSIKDIIGIVGIRGIVVIKVGVIISMI